MLSLRALALRQPLARRKLSQPLLVVQLGEAARRMQVSYSAPVPQEPKDPADANAKKATNVGLQRSDEGETYDDEERRERELAHGGAHDLDGLV